MYFAYVCISNLSSEKHRLSSKGQFKLKFGA